MKDASIARNLDIMPGNVLNITRTKMESKNIEITETETTDRQDKIMSRDNIEELVMKDL